MPDFDFQAYDNQAWAANERSAARIRDIFNRAIREAAALAVSIAPKSGTPFSFEQFPKLREKVNKLFQKLAKQLQQNIFTGNQTAWSIANQKSDALVNYINKRTGIPKRVLYLYDPRNTNALAAFQNRREQGLGLSDRVWKTAQQTRQEIELALSVGLGQGKSAAQLSRQVRDFLQEPERLFRRVRDEHGQLHLSRNAEAYHPGQGVYRSSYKNAMRLTRTENNMAYREADFTRWNNLTFVVGIEVRLSNNPKHCPMCVQLFGKYPKEFKFVGWHPQCRCFAIPILNTDKEFRQMSQMDLNGEDLSDFVSKNLIKDVPSQFKDWIRANKDRVNNWANMPYFIRDNYKGGSISNGLQFAASKPVTESNKFNFNDQTREQLRKRGISIKGDDLFLNRHLAGFDLYAFDNEIETIVGPFNINLVNKFVLQRPDGVMIQYSDDRDLFKLKRFFYFNQDGIKTVDHAYFELDSALQGGGMSKSIFQTLYKQYNNAGVKRIEVHANIDVGGYTWGKYGFNAKSRDKISDVIHRANYRLSEADKADFNKWLASFDNKDRIPMVELASRPYGKKLMLGTDWFGFIDLSDPVQRGIFEDYLFKSK